MRRLRDRGKGGNRDRRSRKMVLDQEQQKVPGRVFLGDRNKLLERLPDPLEKRDNSEQLVLGHSIAVLPACRGSSRSSRPSPSVRRRNSACPARNSAGAIHRIRLASLRRGGRGHALTPRADEIQGMTFSPRRVA